MFPGFLRVLGPRFLTQHPTPQDPVITGVFDIRGHFCIITEVVVNHWVSSVRVEFNNENTDMDKGYSLEEVLRELRKREEGCDERYEDTATAQDFRETNKSVRHWGFGNVAFLTLVIAIVGLAIVGFLTNVQPSIFSVSHPVPTLQTKELQQPVVSSSAPHVVRQVVPVVSDVARPG